MPIRVATYLRVALAETDETWELHEGWLRRKPPRRISHNHALSELWFRLAVQLDRAEYQVRPSLGRVRVAPDSYLVPDVFVLPVALTHVFRGRPDDLEVYVAPLPLLAEVWSPPVEDYDVDFKLRSYLRRGDQEVWRIHPFERTLRAWRRQPDGSYSETVYRGGKVSPVALSNVEIDFNMLFT
jgi:Putative restriction endonuclease